MRYLFILIGVCQISLLMSQTNIHFTNPAMDPILKGNYDPMLYSAAQVIDDPKIIYEQVQEEVSPLKLQEYLSALTSFGNRNTGSDTLSSTFGIGAARNWVLEKFNEFDAEGGGRLETGYLQFERDICGMETHKNVVAVLPGTKTVDPSFIIIEGHLDSRCDGVCDLTCPAEGAEDNGSGTVLVIELARVMSKLTFEHTLVFMATIGEEQGLYGADAFADYALAEDLSIKAVLNNDIIGGILCGETSSAPSCTGAGLIDSTQVRLFSAGGSLSLHKGLARFIKLQYEEELQQAVDVPMQITIMSAEDRTGRGGDHIPFRQAGYTAMRFTAAHEHGDASNGPGYSDHQHTSEDVLGVDTDGDQEIDSFFVDFNYLARNAVINGVSAAAIAIGPETPSFTAVEEDSQIRVTIDDPLNYGKYRVGVRSESNDFDTVHTLNNELEILLGTNKVFNYISVASVDENGVESLFAKEIQVIVINVATDDLAEVNKEIPNISLLPNRPNPFDEATIISWLVQEEINYKSARLTVRDRSGKIVESIPVELRRGTNEILYTHGYGVLGTFIYALEVDNVILASRQMVFAN